MWHRNFLNRTSKNLCFRHDGCFDPNLEPRKYARASNFLGATQTNLRMWEYYQPSVLSFADELRAVHSSEKDPNPAIPLPEGWWLVMAGKSSASGCFGKLFFRPKTPFCAKAISFTDRHTFRKALPKCLRIYSFHQARVIQRHHHAVVRHGSFGYIFILLARKLTTLPKWW